MIVFIALFTVLYGYLCHQTRRFVYARFGTGWRELVSYTAGVLFVFPVFVATFFVLVNYFGDYTQTLRKEKLAHFITRLGIVAYFVSYCPFGLGTFLGWLADGRD